MKLPTPIESDAAIKAKVSMYDEAAKARPDFPEIPDPRENPVPGMSYDEGGMPIMPSDLTATSSKELGQLFQAMEAWHAYFNGLTTDADVEKNRAKDVADLVRAHVKKELRDQGTTKTDVDEQYKLDMRFIEADTIFMSARAMAGRLDNYRDMISRRFTLISREITRRGEDIRFSGMDPDRRFQNRTPTYGTGNDNGFGERKLK